MTVRKRSLIIAALLVAAVVVLTPSVALANYAVHGGYAMSTDACAGCHRAHTASSPITWVDTTGADRSALLLSLASSVDDFCYTCHGVGVLGADTNVKDGMFEARDSNLADDVINADGAPLNGGGFGDAFTGQHSNDSGWPAYGGGPTGLRVDDPNDPGPILIGASGGLYVDVSCTICHDTHGSSNYRLLKDIVNGVQVGGYDATASEINPDPTPWVVSAEPGYPTGGWLLHEPGAAQVAAYTPSYTTPMYAKPADGPDADALPDLDKGISGWCASCHTQYNTAGDSGVVVDTTNDRDGDYLAEPYDANDGYGFVTRHRHPVNVAMSEYAGTRSLVVTANPLPLAHTPADVATQDSTDWLDCLTCHYAHGSSSIMTGYANVAFTEVWDTPWGTTEPIIEPDSGTNGVEPTDANALLRGNNRFVCESCHNK